jgi:hypothetical protein
MTREELLSKLKPETETVEIGRGSVIVVELSSIEFSELWRSEAVKGEDGKVDMLRFTAYLVARCVMAESGERMFYDEDVPVLQNSGVTKFTQLAATAQRVNGIGSAA